MYLILTVTLHLWISYTFNKGCARGSESFRRMTKVHGDVLGLELKMSSISECQVTKHSHLEERVQNQALPVDVTSQIHDHRLPHRPPPFSLLPHPTSPTTWAPPVQGPRFPKSDPTSPNFYSSVLHTLLILTRITLTILIPLSASPHLLMGTPNPRRLQVSPFPWLRLSQLRIKR